jgi:hypothetical protein
MAVAEHKPNARSAKMPKTMTGHELGCVCSGGIMVESVVILVGSNVLLGVSHCDIVGIVDVAVVVVVVLEDDGSTSSIDSVVLTPFVVGILFRLVEWFEVLVEEVSSSSSSSSSETAERSTGLTALGVEELSESEPESSSLAEASSSLGARY